jgi:hypothetical protein
MKLMKIELMKLTYEELQEILLETIAEGTLRNNLLVEGTSID